MLRGRTVTLFERIQVGEDAFHRPVYQEVPVTVENVLIAPASTEDIVEMMNLTGKRAEYQLAIPKGDTHNWGNAKVLFFGKSWKTIGEPLEGQEELIPLQWNRKITVEKFNEQSGD